jgi:hypothetical protein
MDGRRPGSTARASIREASAHVATVWLRLIDPRAPADRNVEVHDAQLHVGIGLVATDVHARGQLDERLTRPVGPDCTTTSVLPGWLCQPVDEWGPNVYCPTIVFVPGWTARPIPVRIDPVAMITGVIVPLPGDAKATVARPIETVSTVAPARATAHRILLLRMVRSFQIFESVREARDRPSGPAPPHTPFVWGRPLDPRRRRGRRNPWEPYVSKIPRALGSIARPTPVDAFEAPLDGVNRRSPVAGRAVDERRHLVNERSERISPAQHARHQWAASEVTATTGAGCLSRDSGGHGQRYRPMG